MGYNCCNWNGRTQFNCLGRYRNYKTVIHKTKYIIPKLMKTFTKKIIFGLAFTFTLSFVIYVLATQEKANEMWYVIVFVVAMKGGIDIWIILLVRERNRLREENLRRKKK